MLLNHYAWLAAGGGDDKRAFYTDTAENDFNVLGEVIHSVVCEADFGYQQFVASIGSTILWTANSVDTLCCIPPHGE